MRVSTKICVRVSTKICVRVSTEICACASIYGDLCASIYEDLKYGGTLIKMSHDILILQYYAFFGSGSILKCFHVIVKYLFLLVSI